MSSNHETLAHERRPGSLTLLAGVLALDFTNTQSGFGGERHLDHLQTAADLIAWASHAKLLTPQEAAHVQNAVKDSPGLEYRIIAQARALRKIIHDINAHVASGRHPTPELLASLTAIHADTLAAASLALRNGNYVWRWDAQKNLTAAILGPVSLSALTLLTHHDFSRIKQCHGDHCGWLFLDTTKNNSRHWCEMKVCGNRAKIRALRARMQKAY